MAGGRRSGRNQEGTPERSNGEGNLVANLSNIIRDQNRAHGEQIQQLLAIQRNQAQNPVAGEQRDARQTVYERVSKMNPPVFEGGADPILAEDWVRSLEVIFEVMQITDAEKVLCSTFLLKKAARTWWDVIKVSLDLTTLTWDQFKKAFYDKYFTRDARSSKVKEFLELNQGEMSVAEYVLKFEEGCRYVPLISEDAEQKMDHFLRGLNPEIRRHVRMPSTTEFREVVDRALMADQDEKEISKPRQEKKKEFRKDPPWRKDNRNNEKKPRTESPPKGERPTCPEYGKQHWGDCLAGKNHCFRCKMPGHMA